jgi:hypothetical protein
MSRRSWNFPLNNYGEVIGLNNAGIETFLGEPITSLAREINQNSLDAADHDSGRPVEVHFTIEKVDSKLFPGRIELQEILAACREYWESNRKANAFFERALSLLQEKTLSILKISDFYTTGLTGSTLVKGSNWSNLIKAVGASDKGGGAGGSFGIGKHAPFACSMLRTVFYSTKDIEGKSAFQGVSKLVTHTDVEGQDRQGTGYFGTCDKNEPIKVVAEIPGFFRRTKTGTDIFVMGFDGGGNWERKIIRSVLENFFVAIHQRKLIVVVGDTRLDDATLPELMQEHFDDNSESDCAKYYKAFTSNDSAFYLFEDFEGLGSLELHILPGQHFPKRIAMVRQAGMLVFSKGHFQTPMKFAGVMRATGPGINELLRTLEPPSHNKWEYERHEDSDYAKKIVKNLYAWVRECVKQTSQDGFEEEYDFEGMQQFLPDDLNDEPAKSSETEGENTILQEVELGIREPAKTAQPNEHKQSQENSGEDGEGTGADGPRDPERSKKSSSRSGNVGEAGSGSGQGDFNNGSDGANAPARVGVGLQKVRAFCIDAKVGAYRVIFQPVKKGRGFLQLRIVGEVEESIAPAVSATGGGVSLSINKDGLIGPISFHEGMSQEISVVLADQLHCALEVVAYEDQ